jgi:hypothetical protein
MLLSSACAGAGVMIEDWSRLPVGAMGIPPDWYEVEPGGSPYDMTIVADAGRSVLQFRSTNGSMSIRKDINGKIDLKKTPILEWSWNAIVLPQGGDSREDDKRDMVAQLYVTWPRFLAAVRSRTIGYVWDTTAPQGTIVKLKTVSAVTLIVIRSGPGDLGNWVMERRNIYEDFKTIYGEYPNNPAAIVLASNSHKTNSIAEAYVGAILLRAP